MIVRYIYLHAGIHLVGIHQTGLSIIFPTRPDLIFITFSWTAIRCQKFDETVEEPIPVDEKPPTTVLSSSTDWCDDADAWNSDDDDDSNEKKPSSISPTIKKEIKKEPEVIMLNSMKIEDENENENEKSSSDEDNDAVEVETKKKSNNKNVSVASSNAFNEWKKTNLNPQTLEISPDASFPFYYIIIEDEESIISEAKVYEKKKLKNKIKKLGDIDEEDEDDETTKGGKEYELILN
jgi:hypothetical protein